MRIVSEIASVGGVRAFLSCRSSGRRARSACRGAPGRGTLMLRIMREDLSIERKCTVRGTQVRQCGGDPNLI